MSAPIHGHVTGVTRETHGDQLVAPVTNASTTLAVIDTADFDEDGGYVRVRGPVETGGWIAPYVGIDDSAATVLLAGSGFGTADAGDLVEVWDFESSEPVAEYIADVVDDVTGGLIQANVEHALVDLLEQSVRAGATESVVCEVDEDGVWTITQILGRVPVRDGTFIDPETIPPPEPPAAPLAPVLAAPTSTPYVAGTQPRSSVSLSWSAVTTDVEGGTIEDLIGYVVEQRVGAGQWQTRTQTGPTTTTAVLDNFTPAQSWSFRISAVRGDVVQATSVPSNVGTITTASDTTPPATPSTPSLTVRLGIIRVRWDGLTSSAGAMDSDLSRVEIHVSTTSGFTPTAGSSATLLNTLPTAGTVDKSDGTYNVTYYVRLLAVDVWGNVSPPSTQASVVVQPLVDTDLIGAVIANANIKSGTIVASDKIVANTITGGLIQALAIDTGHLKANAITAEKIDAGAITAVKLSADAIDGKTITGAVMQTDSTGKRVVVDGPNDVIQLYTGLSGETPGKVDPEVVGGKPRVAVRPASTPTHAVQPFLVLGSGSLASGLADTAAAEATLDAETGVARLVGRYVEITADVACSVNGPLTSTMDGGGVGTGAFRTSVDSRVTAIAPGVTMAGGSVGTGAFRDSVDARVFAVSDYYQSTSTADATPTTTTNVAIPTMDQVVVVPSTSAVYRVDLDLDMQITTAGATGIAELLVDGSLASARTVLISGPAGTRGNMHRGFFITGLAAGNRTFGVRTRSAAAATTTAVRVGSTMQIQRIK